ncbi:MAG TPA: 3-deoxy-manno-octulosonate cytidylyltransferase [Campylobacterales bacterium]|nr:3-deoxy-manno-octulosonate cytidylyltransferase [Campylobacterales bacterium]
MNIAIIPARLNSSRLPNKVILDICGSPLIEWVYRQVNKSKLVDRIYIATDSPKVADIVRGFGGTPIMTSPHHQSGTDRIGEAVEKVEGDIIINIQGDEPLIDSGLVDRLIEELQSDEVDFVSAMSEIATFEELQNPNIVKVVTDTNRNGIYFSRYPIPFCRDGDIDISNYRKHIGIYGYTREFLHIYNSLPNSFLEQSEKLEQLRAIEYGYKIRMVETQYSGIGVDTQDDLERVKKILCGE